MVVVVVEMRKFDQELDMQASSFCCGLLSKDSEKSLFFWSKIERNKGGPAVQRSLKRSAIPLTSQTEDLARSSVSLSLEDSVFPTSE